MLFNIDETWIRPTSHQKLDHDDEEENEEEYQQAEIEPSLSSNTIILTTTADGSVLPVVVLVPYDQVQKPDSDGTSPSIIWIRKDNPRMSAKDFLHTFTTVIIPHIQMIRTSLHRERETAAIILDGGVGHFGYQVKSVAAAQNIDLIKLPSNTSTILQPNDQSIKIKLKTTIREELQKNTRKDTAGLRDTFARALATAIPNALNSSSVQKSWKDTGLYPCNPDNILKHIPRNPPLDFLASLKDRPEPDCSRFGHIYKASEFKKRSPES